MSGAEEPPGIQEHIGAEAVAPTDLQDPDKCQVPSYKDIIMKNRVDLKKREEEVQAYVNKLSKIKSRSKLSRRSTDSSSSLDSSRLDSSLPKLEESDVKDITEAKTVKAKSHLLQKKLAENRKIFEQRSKEITESNREIEEKVEEIRKQITETELQKEILPAASIPSKGLHGIHEKDNKIEELSTKVHELEAIIIDLQDSLKEKDAVIDSKTKAVTLMSEDLSKRGKTTLDTLEETKDEMRAMQSTFVLMETSFKDKHEHLLGQLEERSNRVIELENKLKSVDQTDLSASAIVGDMRQEMTSMQENFVLIESSLKDKVNNLIVQLEDRESRLAELEKTLSKENSNPDDDKLKQLEANNRVLTEENEKLKKTVENLKIQEKANRDKDDRILALEKTVMELEGKAEGENVQRLTKELDDLNKSMIKLKAQHKAKLRSLNNRLENFRKVSDANAELVNLGNQVALLEEEKASSVNLQSRISELESKVEAQTSVIQTHVEAIAALENQKLDLMQDLHTVKQEVSALEAENADCENLRVTAELKVVELEDQLESLHRVNIPKPEIVTHKDELDDAKPQGVDSFESIEENRNELLKQVDILTQQNQNLEMQLREFRQKDPVEKKSSDTDSTESFERISETNDGSIKNDVDEASDFKKITSSEEKVLNTQENFAECHRRIENLVHENSLLVIELTKTQERLNHKKEDYESKLTSIEAQNSELRENLTSLCNQTALISLSAQVSQCIKMNEDQLQLVENLEMELLRSNQELSHKREEITECQRMIKSLTLIQSKLSEMEDRIEQLVVEKSAIAQKFEISSSELTEVTQKSKELNEINTGRIDKLLSELLVQTSTISSQNNEISSLKEVISTNNRILEELTEENTELKSRIDALENEKSSILEKNIHLTKQLELKEDSIAALEGEFKTTVSIIEDGLKDKEVMLMSSERQIPLLQDQLEEKSKEIDEFEKKIEWIEALAQAKEMSLSEEKEKLTLEFENNVASLEKVLENKTSLVASLQTEIQSLLETLKNNEVTIITLQGEINSLHSELSEKEIAAVSMTERTNVDQESFIEKESLYQSCTSTLASDQIESAAATVHFEEKISNLESEIENSNLFIAKLKKDIDNITEAHMKVKKENEELKLNQSLLENSVAVLNNELEQSHNELKSMTIGMKDNIEECHNLKLKNDEVNITVNLIDKELKSKINELEQCIIELERKESIIYDLKENVERLSGIITENESNSTALKAEIMELQEALKEISVLKSRNEELMENMMEKEETLIKLKSTITEIREQLDRSNIKVRELQGLLNDRESAVFVLSTEKEGLIEQISSEKSGKEDALTSIQSLNHEIENQRSYIEEIRQELTDAYKMMENLKQKHTEDIEMQNQRLEETIIDLQNKKSENNNLSLLLEEKEKIINQSVTADIKLSLEQQIDSLENQLKEVNSTSQAQLQKMKVIAANLKKKTVQCQELEAKTYDFEEKWTNEQSEKEEMSHKLQQVLVDLEIRNNQIGELEKQLISYEKNATASDEVSRLSEGLSVANNTILDLNDRIKLLQSEVDSLSSDIAEKVQELATEKSTKDSIISQFETYKEFSESERRVGEESLELLNSELSVSNERIEFLNEEIKRNKEALKEMEEMSKFNQELTSEIGILKTEMVQSNEKIEFLNEEIKRRTTEVEQIEQISKSKLQESSSTIESFKAQIAESKDALILLKNQLDLSVEGLHQKSSEITLLSSEMVSRNERIDCLTLEIDQKNHEMASLNSELSSKLEEISSLSSELTSEKQRQLSLSADFESLKVMTSAELSALSQELEDSKERARELGVRMQVMETEYVDQLNTIQTLRTENGFLSSKHAQINERLENTEAESIERFRVIEALRADLSHLKASQNPPTNCDHCERCQDLVNALEGKLQERNAEIQNLDNELANSVANFLQMRENLRTQELQCSEESQEARKSLAQFNDLLARNTENEKRIQELHEQITNLNERNSGLNEELDKTREKAEMAQRFELLYLNLSKVHEERESELEDLTKKFEALRSEKADLSTRLQNQEIVAMEGNIPNSEVLSAPQLFDAAKLFDAPSPWDPNHMPEDIAALKNQLEDVQTQKTQLLSQLDQLSTEISSYTQKILVLTEKNRQLSQISAETNQLKALLHDHERQIQLLNEENNQLRAELFQRQEFIARSVEDLSISQDSNKADVVTKEKEELEKSICDFISEARTLMSEENSEGIRGYEYSAELAKIISTIRSLQQRQHDSSPVHKREILAQEITIVPQVDSLDVKKVPSAIQDEDIRIDDDEEWGWNAQDAELGSGLPLASICTGETQLGARIAELGDTIRDLEDEKVKINEDLKVAQVRSGKLVKKLKEFKVQNENLQKQLKLQKASGGLCDLNSAIEDELKSQLVTLERQLADMRSDHQKIIAERDNLMKRVDVLMAANERFTEMKERQDREIEVLHIRNKELSTKIGNVEKDIGEKLTLLETCETEVSGDVSKEQYEELQESLEMLASENEQLRTLLETEKSERLAIELSLTERMREIEESKNQTDEMKIGFDETLKKCQNLEKECIANLESATQTRIEAENNHAIILEQALQHSNELQGEISERNERIRILEDSLTASQQRLNGAQETLSNVTESLNERVQEVAELTQQLQQLPAARIEAATCLQKLVETEEDMSRKLSQQHEDLSRKLIENEEDLTRKLHDREDDLSRKLAETREELSRQLLNKDAEILELKKLHTTLEEKSEEIGSLSSKVEELLLERQTLISTMEGQTQELQSLKESLYKNEWLVETLSTESTTSKETISTLELDLKSSKEEINALTASITSLTTEIGQKVEDIASQEREISNMKSFLGKLQLQVENPDNQVCSRCEEHNAILSANQETIAALKTDLESSEDELNHLTTSIASLRTEITKKNEDIASQDQAISNLQSMVTILQSQSPEPNDEMCSKCKENAEILSEMEALREKLRSKGMEVADLKYILNQNTYPRIFQELQDRVNSLYNEKSQLESSLNSALEQIQVHDVPMAQEAFLEEEASSRVESLRKTLEMKDIELESLRKKLEGKTTECSLLENALAKQITSSSGSDSQVREHSLTSSELDVALYMLHQRDVRCEELTHELMQLLEERDTLQLRLSNAIRLNEEMRRGVGGETSILSEQFATQEPEKKVEDTSGDKTELAQKLSQLHTVGHRRDIRLMDDRELRNTQQMSLLAHKDALSTLPPDAAARLINANYTLSRDVQSQSSVLLNWLWGKSTPKVVHM